MQNAPQMPAPDMPLHLHWDSHELASAVPLRLSELLDFNAANEAGNALTSANGTARSSASRYQSYLPVAGFHTGFHVR